MFNAYYLMILKFKACLLFLKVSHPHPSKSGPEAFEMGTRI
jgi:hypothetical protein